MTQRHKPSLSVVSVPGGRCVEVVVRGDLDLEAAPQLAAAVTAACTAHLGPAQTVVLRLDLHDVTFMDSAALHALADIDAELTRRGWSLRVIPPAARGPRRLLLLAARRRWLRRWRTGLPAGETMTTRAAAPATTEECDGSSVSVA